MNGTTIKASGESEDEPTTSSTYVERWKEEWESYGAYRLANDADCAGPDSQESAGAKFLSSVRDDVIEHITYAWEYSDLDESERYDANRASDVAHEVADNAPDVYTYTMWAEFTDLAAWQEDPSELGTDSSDMEQSARVCLYMIAERLASAMLADLQERAEDEVTE